MTTCVSRDPSTLKHARRRYCTCNNTQVQAPRVGIFFQQGRGKGFTTPFLMKVSIVTRRIRTGDVRPLLFSECKGIRATCFPHFSSCIHPFTHPPALPPSTFPLPASLLGVPSLSVAQLHNSRIGHSKCNANALLYSLRATVVCNQTVIASLLRTTRIRFPDELCASFKDVGPFFPSLPRPRSHEKILLAPRMHALIYTHEDMQTDRQAHTPRDTA